MSEEKNQNEIEEVTNEDEHKDVEHYCYLCRRPESAAGNDWPAGRTAPTAELRHWLPRSRRVASRRHL